MSQHQHNPMRPYLGTLVGLEDLATDIKLFKIELTEPEGQTSFADYRPGQFAFVSALGVGEAPFGITSIPSRGDVLEFGINKLGHVTEALHNLEINPIVTCWTLYRGSDPDVPTSESPCPQAALEVS